MLIPHTTQFNDPTTGLDALNCTCAIGATCVRWHYRDQRPEGALGSLWPPFGGMVRALVREDDGSADVAGGTNYVQVADAIKRGWGVPMDVVNNGAFDEAWELAQDPEVFVALAIQYEVLDGTWHDAGGAFLGAHAVGFANAGASVCDFTDPLADGRRPGIPIGVQRMRRETLKLAASQLVVNRSGARAGFGRAWFAIVRAKPLPPLISDLEDVMFNVGPIVTERDAVLKKGAVLYEDSALLERRSAVSKETPLGFVGSTATAHVVVNAGNTNYVRREDVARIVANRRTFQ